MTTQSMPDNPFVGLRPFRSEESLLFFGRRQQTVELLDRLHRTRFVSVVGSSGCGKSSLVRAGLLPKLEAGFLVEDRDRWISATMTPGEAPIEKLAAGVLSAISTPGNPSESARLIDGIRGSGGQAIVEALAPILDESEANCLLLVDQFEELFRFGLRTRQVERRDEATDFVSILLALAEQRASPIYIVMTMRSDFLGDCDAFFGLPEAMNRSQYLVPRLTRQQRREAVEGPVRLYGQSITPQLLDRVLNDAGEEPDQLPIMQHALLRTWENWQQNDSGSVDLPHYQAIGTTKEALSRDADAALRGMSEEDLNLTRRLFQALTDTDAANRRIRRPARLSELEAITEAPRTKVMEIIDRFRGHGRSFLVLFEDKIRGDALIDICHESLIRQWKRLRDWVDQEAESRRVYLDIADAATRRKALWRDPDLQLTLDWRDRTQPNAGWASRYHPDFVGAMAFLEASREQRDHDAQEKQRQQRRERRMSMVIFALSVLSLVVPTYLYYSAKQVEKAASERADAKIEDATKQANAKIDEATRTANHRISEAKNDADRIVERARIDADNKRKEAEAEHKYALGLRLATDALRQFDDTWDGLVRSALLAIESLQVDPTIEGRKALFQALRLIPPAPEVIPTPHKAWITSLAYSRDGRWLASGDESGLTILWDASKMTNARKLWPPKGAVYNLGFSRDGRWLAVGVYRGAQMWEAETGNLTLEYAHPVSKIFSVDFSPDGLYFAAAPNLDYAPNPSVAPDLFDYAQLYRLTGDKWEKDQSWRSSRDFAVRKAFRFGSPNTLIEAGSDGVMLSKTAQGVRPLFYRQEWCTNLSVSDQGDLLAAGCRGGVLLVAIPPPNSWGFQPFRVVGSSGELAVALRSDGKYVAASGFVAGSSETRIYQLNGGLEVSRFYQAAKALAFRADGTLAAGVDNSIVLLPARKGLESIRLPHEGIAVALAFSPNEKWLATAEQDGSVRILDLVRRREIRSLQVGPDLQTVMFAPDGRFLLVVDKQGVRVFEAGSWKRLRDRDIAGDFTSLDFSPDGRTLIARELRRIRCFSTTTLIEKASISGTFHVVRFSPNGVWLVCLQRGRHGVRNTRLVNLRTGKVEWQEESEAGSSRSTGHRPQLITDSYSWIGREVDLLKPRSSRSRDESLEAVRSEAHFAVCCEATERVSRFPDGTTLLDSTVELRETASQRPIARFEHEDKVLDQAFSPTGRWLATTSADTKVRLWPLQPHEMIDQACKLLPRNLTEKEWEGLKLEGHYHRTCPNLP